MVHPERRRRTRELDALAARCDWEELYRRVMLSEFPRAAQMGWQLAFLRPFAVPRMAQVLVDSGHLVHDPLKRTYDTGLIIYELVHGGCDSPRGRQMISVMNRAHRGHGILGADMTYVLCAFVVAPLRYIDRTGWRRLTAAERHSAVEFYAEMGRRMSIERIPASYAEAETIFDTYEAAQVAPSEAGRVLGANLIMVLAGRLPRAARLIAAPVFATQLGDARIARALGLAWPPRIVHLLAAAVAAARRLTQRHRPPSGVPIFTPGMRAGRAYPNGYDIGDLGPDAARS